MPIVPFLQDFEPKPIVYYDFTPPLGGSLPPWRKETPVEDRRFHGRFRSGAYAMNIHKLIDGSFTEVEGIDPAFIVKTYRGSVITPVTATEAIDLIAAGYPVPAFENGTP